MHGGPHAVAKLLVVCELAGDDDHAGAVEAEADASPQSDVAHSGTQASLAQLVTSRSGTPPSNPQVVPAVEIGVKARRASAAVRVELSEYVVLDDGQKILIRNDRGLGLGENRFNIWQRWNEDRLTQFICEYIVEDHNENLTVGDWMMEQLERSHQLTIDRGSLQEVLSASPTVEFGNEIQAKWRELAVVPMDVVDGSGLGMS
ncbi:hypothetical protein [Candidatus Poriferisodalis sp.]|uniref:hypothetical protein n=1 Tax=Candidatus Poriferisodalis sp. TaxID=3101277 RepID=UPI003B024A27